MLKFLKLPLIKYFPVIVLACVIPIQSLFAASDLDKEFIAKQKANEANITAPYVNEIAKLAETAKRNAQAPEIQTYIHQLQQNSQGLLSPVPATQPVVATGQILIFVSASMSQASLQQWFNQAQKIHAAFIVRGFINNSLPNTKNWVKELIESNNKKGGIQINPIAFERFEIQQVPAVVISNKTYQCPTNMSCMTPPFDVVYGNVNLREALKTIANQGEVSNEIARQALIQMEKSHD